MRLNERRRRRVLIYRQGKHYGDFNTSHPTTLYELFGRTVAKTKQGWCVRWFFSCRRICVSCVRTTQVVFQSRRILKFRSTNVQVNKINNRGFWYVLILVQSQLLFPFLLLHLLHLPFFHVYFLSKLGLLFAHQRKYIHREEVRSKLPDSFFETLMIS